MVTRISDGSIYTIFELYVRRSTILSASLKEQLLANKGKAYIVNRKNPGVYVEIQDGLIKFDKNMINSHAYLDFPENTFFPKDRMMDVFDQQYAKKLNLNPQLIPDELKSLIVDGKLKWKDISKFRKNSKYVWHEDISGRVMLIPKEVHNIGYGFRGIPHFGAVSVSNKNIKAMQVYEMMKQLRR